MTNTDLLCKVLTEVCQLSYGGRSVDARVIARSLSAEIADVEEALRDLEEEGLCDQIRGRLTMAGLCAAVKLGCSATQLASSDRRRRTPVPRIGNRNEAMVANENGVHVPLNRSANF